MLETQTRNDRRRYLRVTPSMSNPIVGGFRLAGADLKNIPVIDISLGGVAVTIPKGNLNIPPGTHVLDMNFSLPELGLITASGVIRRVQGTAESKSTVCAFEFTKVPTSSDRVLFRYINGRQRELSWFTRH